MPGMPQGRIGPDGCLYYRRKELWNYVLDMLNSHFDKGSKPLCTISDDPDGFRTYFFDGKIVAEERPGGCGWDNDHDNDDDAGSLCDFIDNDLSVGAPAKVPTKRKAASSSSASSCKKKKDPPFCKAPTRKKTPAASTKKKSPVASFFAKHFKHQPSQSSQIFSPGKKSPARSHSGLCLGNTNLCRSSNK